MLTRVFFSVIISENKVPMKNIERVIFIVDIDDKSSVRKKRQHNSDESSENPFFFLMPSNYWEYDPQKILQYLDTSIVDSEEFSHYLPSTEKYSFSREIADGKVVNAVDDLYILIFCKGYTAKNRIRKIFEEICEINPNIEVYENLLCNQHTHVNEIKDFEEFLAPMLNMVASRVRN